jgi:hypothetical protein
LELTILDGIEFRTDADTVLARLGLESGMRAEIAPLVDEALKVARPRACFAAAPVEERGEDSVRVAGQTFNSHILRVNVGESSEVGLFVATCGRELEAWAESHEDMLLRWCAEELCQLALHAAVIVVEERLDSLLPGPRHATMNPGSLEDWPIQQQALFFRALGDVEAAVGVTLTPSFLMRPRKSVSGLRFGTETDYSNCRLCPRQDCPGRRAAYDEMEYERRYGRSGAGAAVCPGGGSRND